MPLYHLLVRVEGRGIVDPERRIARLDRGQVVCVKPADPAVIEAELRAANPRWSEAKLAEAVAAYGWTPRERTNPAWRIVEAEMTKEEALSFLVPLVRAPEDPRFSQVRAFTLDVDALGLAPVGGGRVDDSGASGQVPGADGGGAVVDEAAVVQVPIDALRAAKAPTVDVSRVGTIALPIPGA